MNPKILLICQAPQKRELYVNTLPPLGILGIAANLQRRNIPVDVLDYNIDTRKNLDLKRYDIIGFSINMANISSSLESIREIKTQNPRVKIMVLSYLG